jgi:microcystin-dependent protein
MNVKTPLIVLQLLVSYISYSQIKVGDNLGNHCATKTLNMNNQSLTNVTGIAIGSNTLINANVGLQLDGNKAIVIPHVNNLLSPTEPAIPEANTINGMLVYDETTDQLFIRQNNQWVAFASTNLPDQNILVGNAAGLATPRKITGDFELANNGSASIKDSVINSDKILDATLINEDFKDQSITAEKLSPSNTVGKIITSTATQVQWLHRNAFIYYIGDYKLSGQQSDHENWLICDGRAISRTAYPELFTTIGTAFGAGDGSTTFNIPDLRGRVPAAISSTRFIGQKIGSENISLGLSEMPAHTHTGSTSQGGVHTHPANLVYTDVKPGSGALGANDQPGTDRATTSNGVHTHTYTINNNGSGAAISLMQPTQFAGNYFIYSGNN